MPGLAEIWRCRRKTKPFVEKHCLTTRPNPREISRSKTGVVSSLHQLIPAQGTGVLVLMALEDQPCESQASYALRNWNEREIPRSGSRVKQNLQQNARSAFWRRIGMVDLFPSSHHSERQLIPPAQGRPIGNVLGIQPVTVLDIATLPLVQYNTQPCWYQCMRQGRATPPLWLFSGMSLDVKWCVLPLCHFAPDPDCRVRRELRPEDRETR